MHEPFRKFVAEEIKDGFLLITCGLVATCKTRVTDEVQQIKGGRLLRTDIIRREVLKNQDIFDSKVAGDVNKQMQVYDAMFEMADEAFGNNRNVILDGTFVSQSLRRRAAGIAAKNNVPLIILQTVCPQEVSIERILARDKESTVSNALTEEAYLSNKKRFEEVNLDAIKKENPGLNLVHLVVDTAKDPPEDWRITRYENI